MHAADVASHFAKPVIKWSNGSTEESSNGAPARYIDSGPDHRRRRTTHCTSVGIDNVNVGEIADYAGIHRVTVYRHFADRDSILEEVLLRRSRPGVGPRGRPTGQGGSLSRRSCVCPGRRRRRGPANTRSAPGNGACTRGGLVHEPCHVGTISGSCAGRSKALPSLGSRARRDAGGPFSG